MTRRCQLIAVLVGVALYACEDESTDDATTSTSTPASNATAASSSQSASTNQSSGTGGGDGGHAGSDAGGQGGNGAQGGMGQGGGDYIFGRHIDNAQGFKLAADAQGNVMITGQADPPVDFGNGSVASAATYAMFAVKYDSADNVVFAKMFGVAGYHAGQCIAADSSGGLAIGGFSQGDIDFGGGVLPAPGLYLEAVVARLDANGNHLWSKRFTGGSHAYGVAIAASGSVIVVGDAEGGTLDLGGGPLPIAGGTDGFVVALDAAGNHLWSKLFGDTADQEVWSVSVDAAGNVYLVGAFEGVIGFGGSSLTTAGTRDVFVAKLDAAGNHLWSKRFGDASVQWAWAGASDAAGNVVITGNQSGSVDYGGGLLSANSVDVFVARFDPNGAHLFSDVYGGAGDEWARDVSLDATGNIVLTGRFPNSIDFGGGPLNSLGGNDVYLAKLSPTGAHLWSKRFGPAQHQEGLSVAAEGPNVALGGVFTGTIDFDGNVLTYNSGGLPWDGFVARLTQ